MKEEQVKSYLASDEGKRNAERFVKALKECRIICSVKSVSSSGMSRVIRFNEVAKVGYPKKDRYTLYQFNYFFKRIGYTYDEKYDGIRVNGCGMDMVFNTLYGVCETLIYYGVKVPKDWAQLADDYMMI